MKKMSFNEALGLILSEDPRYHTEAYVFVRESLDHTLKSLKRDAESSDRHVSGRELLEGIRDHALQEYGPMSKTLLNFWGIQTCEDFGNIVFNMVNKGVLGKTENDRLEDFHEAYDFEEAFLKPFRPTPPDLKPPPPKGRLNLKTATE
ncbi:MAG: hypothetical protein SFY92_01780 [Verrucomicrobiae bacterium]|nr:hypothetical protein [Verrucomicrobiae bacterium]